MATDEPRRYQTRAASKIVEDHVSTSTKLVLLNPPTPRVARNTTTAGEGATKAKLNRSTAAATAPVELPARKKLGLGPAATSKRGILLKPPRATGIPVPTRVTRSSSARGATTDHIKVAANDIGEPKLPSRGGMVSRVAKKKGLNEDKENRGPTSEIEAKLKQQKVPQNNTHSIDPDPVGAQAAQKMAPGDIICSTKMQIRSIGNLGLKERLSPLLSSPIHASPKRYQHPQVKNGSESPDELDCPVSVTVQPQARRLNNIKLHQPEQVNLLASPPRRNASQPQSRPGRQLPAMVLTFNQPALLMQSPSKRGSTLSQIPARAIPGRQLALPPKMDILGSPPKRPTKKPMSQPVVEKRVDQLSFDTYKVQNLLRQPAKKGLSLATSPKIVQNNRLTEGVPIVSKNGAVPVLLAMTDTDAEGDVEMTDPDTDMEDCISSPCPAKRSQGFQKYNDEGNFPDWGSSSIEERGVAPLVTGLEELGLELKESRRNLFPRVKGRNVSMALEDSAQLELRAHNNEKIPNGEIPIDPILLGGGLANAHVRSDDVSEEQIVEVGTNKAPGKILTGAVVFIDVHPDTTLMKLVGSLQGMGAKAVTTWVEDPDHGGTGTARVGISHVVFQGGSLQTLQKVKESQGIVICVGAEWVVACEKQQRWVDEEAYWIDLDMGQSSRKPAEAFRNILPSIDPIDFPSTDAPSATATFLATTDANPSALTSPAVNHLGFYLGDAGSGDSVGLLEKLLLVRRQSLKYTPKVRSPLGKNCQWADY